jgi:O-antigen/teichoic acid export membrane protein
MTAPFMALIIAHEDMNIFASVSVFEAILKLAVVFLLKVVSFDKLQLYGILLTSVASIPLVIYLTSCKVKYQECKFQIYWNKDLFKEISQFAGWNLFGEMAAILKRQGENILLNQFFNPLIITARAIASSVASAVFTFPANFTTAMRPQVVKNYAAGNSRESLLLVFRGMKGTYFLVYLVSLPLILEMPTVLLLWLKTVPAYTILFARLMIIDMLFQAMCYPINIAIQATGKIKLYQSVIGGIQLFNLPISWVALVFGAPAYSIMVIAISITSITFIVRLLILRRFIDFSIKKLFKYAVFPACVVTVISCIIPLVIYIIMDQSTLRLCLVVVVSIILVSGCIYTIGLNDMEKDRLKAIILNKIRCSWRIEKS